MKYDYDKGDLNKHGITSGGLSKREEEVRSLIKDTLKNADLNADIAYFGVLFYHKGNLCRCLDVSHFNGKWFPDYEDENCDTKDSIEKDTEILVINETNKIFN